MYGQHLELPADQHLAIVGTLALLPRFFGFSQNGDGLTLGLESRSPLLMVQPSYAPETKLFGGQASIGLGIGYGSNTTSTSTG
ncbi:MAG: hypothetical protein ABI593_11135 [Betaproteobacteria bacterium]